MVARDVCHGTSRNAVTGWYTERQAQAYVTSPDAGIGIPVF